MKEYEVWQNEDLNPIDGPKLKHERLGDFLHCVTKNDSVVAYDNKIVIMYISDDGYVGDINRCAATLKSKS